MMGLGTTVVGDQAFRDARFVLDLCQLVTDREGVVAQIKQWVEARNELKIARAEAVKAEQAVALRERQAAKHEEALAKREEALVDRELKAQAVLHRAEEARSTLEAMRAEVRKSLAA